MHIEITYEKDFNDLWMHLKSKYSKELFDSEGIGKQLDLSEFSKHFFGSKIISDASIDSNANVDDISVIAYSNEIKKPYEKLNSYYMTWRELKRLYGLQVANEIIEMQLIGDIYINDFHGIGAGMPYCYNYSTYDIMLSGLPMIKKIKSYPPKYLYAFKSQIEQFVTIASNSTLGATGLADVLVIMSFYVENILNTKSDAHFNLGTEENCWTYVKENLVSMIYTINQPMRAHQSPFTNISVYDKYFLEKLCADYTNPNTGDHPKIEIVQKLQEIFLDIMNEELKRTPITFPITTACFTTNEENEIMDENFLDMISKKNIEYGFINIYAGKSSTLSSCCFTGDEVIEVTNKITGITEIISIKNFVKKYISKGELKIDTEYSIKSINKDSLEVVDTDIIGVLAKDNTYNKLIEFDTNNGIISVTPDHKFFVKEINTNNIIELTAEEISKNIDNYMLPIIAENMIQFVKINKVEIKTSSSMVYDIELKDNHYFSANNIISHNCRLRSESDNEYFNSFGSGSSKIGSLGVCTVNLPRLGYKNVDNEETLFVDLEKLVRVCAKINNTKRKIVKRRIDNGNHPLYDNGFMNLDKQYSTVGINGFYELLEIMGYDILTDEGVTFGLKVIDFINKENKKHQTQYKAPHNLEQIPGENVSIKLCVKDKMMGFENKYELYSNQFIPLLNKADMLDRIRLQGVFDSHFTGGSILHLNIENKISKVEDLKELIKMSVKMKVIYFAVNYNLQMCKGGHLSVGRGEVCNICGSEITDNYTRVVGFLTNSKNWHKTRRDVDYPNRLFYKEL